MLVVLPFFFFLFLFLHFLFTGETNRVAARRAREQKSSKWQAGFSIKRCSCLFSTNRNNVILIKRKKKEMENILTRIFRNYSMIEECFVEQSIDYSARSHHTFVAFNGLIKILCRACGPTFFLFNNRNTVSGNLTLKPQGSLNKSPFFRFPHPSCSNFPRTRNKKRRRRKKKQKEKNDKTKTETLSGRKFGEHRRCRRWLSIARKGADVENSCGLASTRV